MRGGEILAKTNIKPLAPAEPGARTKTPRSMSSNEDDMPIRRRDSYRRRLGKAAKRQREHDRVRDILKRQRQNLSDPDEDYPSPARRRARTAIASDHDVDRYRRRSPSPMRRRRRALSYGYSDDEDVPDRSPSPRLRQRARSYTYSDDEDYEHDEPDRRSRSPSPRRRRRARFSIYSDDEDEDESDSPSRSPRRRRRARSNSYSDEEEEEEEPDRRSRSRSPRSPRRRVAPRSCRSKSRSRSEECEDTRCCPPKPADDGDNFFVRIDRTEDHLFKCATCHLLLPPPVVYECVEGHVTCATCHSATNGDVGEGDRRCSQCDSSNYGPSRTVSNWLRSVRFPCRNHGHGCPTFLPRHAMESDHEPTCAYSPVFCPVRSCEGFRGGPTDQLERHLAAHHAGWSVDAFRYGEPVRVRVRPEGEAARCVLRAEEDGELFHLRAVPERGGTAVSMIRICPDNAPPAEFEYEVRTHAAAGMKHRMQMQSTVWATSLAPGAEDAHNNPVSVIVPDDMLPVDGPEQDSVEVRVRKVAPAAAAAAAAPARDN